MRDLIKMVIPRVSAKWVTLAYSMKYSINAVGVFEAGGRDLDEQCRKFFEDWLNTGHGSAPKTWQTLLEHLRQLELIAAVEEIEKDLINCKE